MVRAAQAFSLRNTPQHVHVSMRAELLHESVLAGAILVGNEMLTENIDRACGVLVELADGGKGHPVATHQLAHGCSGPHPCKSIVLFLREHVASCIPWS